MAEYFETRVEFIKGVGPRKSVLLNKELNIFTYRDLIEYYPFRYEDRTKFYKISELNEEMPFVQIIGKIRHMEMAGPPKKQRLVVYFTDGTGEIQLVWFKGAKWILNKLRSGVEYVVFGKANQIGRFLNIAHPDIEPFSQKTKTDGYLQPVYHTTERLKTGFLDSRGVGKIQQILVPNSIGRIKETLPEYIRTKLNLISKKDAIANIHFPKNNKWLAKAIARLKFEELFYLQLRILKLKLIKVEKSRGIIFDNASLLNIFYNDHLPFSLTGAQKRVIKEIYKDLKSGTQMNRLLQGDVGSGKTIVAFICMLIAISNNTQTVIMAPTSILANQHYDGLKEYADKIGIEIALLTGASKKSERNVIHESLENGTLKILVGTHALLEDVVKFQNLGFVVIDEQHRFGVAQRAKLWNKNIKFPPHVLVMTATPIPRTLAMTIYGDLEISVIDELPAGRKEIKTTHQFDTNRLKVFGFIQQQIQQGRQVYIVYPLIEESEKLDLKHLEDGYESIRRAFPETPVSVLHGKMKADAKDYEMNRFVKGETKIMVATTVIEVGVNVPNASVMIIENAERFGLAQLHQLRGRVGRGADQSYCILITKYALSKDAKIRIKTMVETTDGFKIADVDMRLRGPGDIQGTQQSGILGLSIANLAEDGQILLKARDTAKYLLDTDPEFKLPENSNILQQVSSAKRGEINWSRIS